MKKALQPFTLVLMVVYFALILTGCQSSQLTGFVALPEGMVAFEDIKISVACVRVSDEIPEEQTVVIPKGKSEISFKLKSPEEDSAYFFRYLLYSKGGEGSKEGLGISTNSTASNLLVGGLSISNHVYAKEGYLAENGMTTNSDDKALLTGDMLDKQRLIIQLEEGIEEKTASILEDIIKPGMSDYEKEKAIYSYVISAVPLKRETVNAYVSGSIQEKDNPLMSALVDLETVWLGQPFLMKWLLHNAGIESELVEARMDFQNFTSVFNLVKIDNLYYYVDTLAASVVSEDQPLIFGDYTFKDIDHVKAYVMARHFNFTDDYLSNSGVKLIGENGTPPAAKDLVGYELVKRYLSSSNLSVDKVKRLKVALELPKGVEAPPAGLWVSVTARSGEKTKSIDDDYFFDQWILMPNGEKRFEISLPLVETNMGFTIDAYEPRSKMFGVTKLDQILNRNDAVILKLDY